MKLDESIISTLKDNKSLLEINQAFQKAEELFKSLHLSLHHKIIEYIPIKSSGKVSKGQNYRGLPYLVSDIPNYFKKKDIFCCRTMFWWGNELSFGIYLAGESLNKYKNTVLAFQPDHYFCVNSSPWEYHFGEDNYVKSETLHLQQKIDHIEKRGFIKLVNKLPIDSFDTLEHEAFAFYSSFLTQI